jgi:hypothetical protein
MRLAVLLLTLGCVNANSGGVVRILTFLISCLDGGKEKILHNGTEETDIYYHSY